MHSQRRSAHSGPVIRVQYTPHPVTDRRSPAIRSFESLRMAVSQFPSAARLLPRQYSGLALIRSLPVADQVLILRLQFSSFQRRIEPTRAPPFQGGSCFSRINVRRASITHTMQSLPARLGPANHGFGWTRGQRRHALVTRFRPGGGRNGAHQGSGGPDRVFRGASELVVARYKLLEILRSLV